jgi:hypothetical protein
MLLYHKDPETSTPKLLDTINSVNKVAGYKISLEKAVAFLYTNNELIEKEYRKKIPFTIDSKTIKYLGINLRKDVNDSTRRTTNYYRKKLKKTAEGGKISHAHGLTEST